MKISLKLKALPFFSLMSFVIALSGAHGDTPNYCALHPTAPGCGAAVLMQDQNPELLSIAPIQSTLQTSNAIPLPNITAPYSAKPLQQGGYSDEPTLSEEREEPVLVSAPTSSPVSEELPVSISPVPEQAPPVVAAVAPSAPAPVPSGNPSQNVPDSVQPVVVASAPPSVPARDLSSVSAVRVLDNPPPVIIDKTSSVGLPKVAPQEVLRMGESNYGSVKDSVFGRKGEPKTEEKSIEAYSPTDVNYVVKSSSPSKPLKSGMKNKNRFASTAESGLDLGTKKKSLNFNSETDSVGALDRFNKEVSKVMHESRVSQEAAQRSVIAKTIRMQSSLLRVYYPDTKAYPKVGQLEFMALSAEQQKEYKARMTRSLELAVAELKETGELPKKDALLARVMSEEGAGADKSDVSGAIKPTASSAEKSPSSTEGGISPQLMGSSLDNPVTVNPDAAQKLLSSVDNIPGSHESHIEDSEGQKEEEEDEEEEGGKGKLKGGKGA